MSATTEKVRHLLTTRVGFGFAGLEEAAQLLLDHVDGLTARIHDLETRLAEYDDRGGPSPRPGQGPPATPPRAAPAAPVPGSASGQPILPQPARAARQADRGENRIKLLKFLAHGPASKVRLRRDCDIVAGSLEQTLKRALDAGEIVNTGRREKTKGPASPIYALADNTLPPALERPAVSPRVRKELERSVHDAAGLPEPRDPDDEKLDQLCRALINGPRDHIQLARILGIPVRAAAELMVTAHQAGRIVVEQGVARLV